ncbi:hypothetical protein BCR32DRAFT_289398 [Anaeromyces robustus]|uniref:Ribonuclease H2 subunit B n=1 Tax=Anaeromyces robustus TaxID=1754192 RepID=A0A1Y1XNN0_9FUNG|nr:hypothetical protein BCR32DRAFT_289398 [Anaeromyces robustus]|eukprot:ORX87275.1 hypothetical protein BCR32DRAFT_289398 [Anaeromyces robustus]
MSDIVIFIPNDEQQKQDKSNFELFKLKHPSTGILSYFCIKNNELYELKQLSNENERSWFIENNVKKEGSFYCISPFNPLFIFINIFENAKNKNLYQNLDVILYNDEIPGYSQLIKMDKIEEELNNICDINVLSVKANDTVFKFNETKALNWLNQKIEDLCQNFDNLSLCVNLLNKINSSEDIEFKKKRIAVIIMSEYLSVKWAVKLENSLNLPEPKEEERNYVYAEEEDFSFNSKRASQSEVPKAKKKKTTLTLGQQRLAKANKSGMKNLEFFFKKK